MRAKLTQIASVATVCAVVVVVAWVKWPDTDSDQRKVAVIAPLIIAGVAILTSVLSNTQPHRPVVKAISARGISRLTVRRYVTTGGSAPSREVHMYVKDMQVDTDAPDVAVDVLAQIEIRQTVLRWWSVWVPVISLCSRIQTGGTGNFGGGGSGHAFALRPEERIPEGCPVRLRFLGKVVGHGWKSSKPLSVPTSVIQAINGGIPVQQDLVIEVPLL